MKWKELRERVLELRNKKKTYTEIAKLLKLNRSIVWYLTNNPTHFFRKKERLKSIIVECLKNIPPMKVTAKMCNYPFTYSKKTVTFDNPKIYSGKLREHLKRHIENFCKFHTSQIIKKHETPLKIILYLKRRKPILKKQWRVNFFVHEHLRRHIIEYGKKLGFKTRKIIRKGVPEIDVVWFAKDWNVLFEIGFSRIYSLMNLEKGIKENLSQILQSYWHSLENVLNLLEKEVAHFRQLIQQKERLDRFLKKLNPDYIIFIGRKTLHTINYQVEIRNYEECSGLIPQLSYTIINREAFTIPLLFFQIEEKYIPTYKAKKVEFKYIGELNYRKKHTR